MNWWTLLLMGSLGALTSLPLRAAEMGSVANEPGSSGGWGRGSASSGGTQPTWPPSHQAPWHPQEPTRPPAGGSGSSSFSSGGDRPNPLAPYPNRGGTTVYPWRYYRPVPPSYPPYPYPYSPYTTSPGLYSYPPNYPRSGYLPIKPYVPAWEYPQSPNGVKTDPFWK
jgi:hypothetical protein